MARCSSGYSQSDSPIEPPAARGLVFLALSVLRSVRCAPGWMGCRNPSETVSAFQEWRGPPLLRQAVRKHRPSTTLRPGVSWGKNTTRFGGGRLAQLFARKGAGLPRPCPCVLCRDRAGEFDFELPQCHKGDPNPRPIAKDCSVP